MISAATFTFPPPHIRPIALRYSSWSSPFIRNPPGRPAPADVFRHALSDVLNRPISTPSPSPLAPLPLDIGKGELVVAIITSMNDAVVHTAIVDAANARTSTSTFPVHMNVWRGARGEGDRADMGRRRASATLPDRHWI